MNIQQFQYILAVEEKRHFELAAEKCFITQSTLSTMISKFEDEIGIKVFDRKQKPVGITKEGKLILNQLRVISKEIDQLKELTKEIKGELAGALSISVIPTIAPFLLPLFLQSFASKFPKLSIKVKEQTTEEIIRRIRSREIDIGIISIPIQDNDIVELELYDEPFVFYDTDADRESSVSIEQLNLKQLYLLEEGHCMRTQVLKLCDLHKKNFKNELNFEFKAGSIDSLLRFVKSNSASTLLPFLATTEFSSKEKKCISKFVDPEPFRKVGLVVHRNFVKKTILEKLKQEITEKVLPLLPPSKVSRAMLPPV